MNKKSRLLLVERLMNFYVVQSKKQDPWQPALPSHTKLHAE